MCVWGRLKRSRVAFNPENSRYLCFLVLLFSFCIVRLHVGVWGGRGSYGVCCCHAMPCQVRLTAHVAKGVQECWWESRWGGEGRGGV